MRTDLALDGILIQDANEDGLITDCQSSGNLDDTAEKFAVGCSLTDSTTGKMYYNSGSVAVPVWTPVNENITVAVDISAADIVATSAGAFGHASGVPLVADPGAGKAIELVSVVLNYKYDTAAYGGGGNITVNSNGGSALTGLVSAANSVGASADKVVQFVPLATAGNAITSNKGLNLVAASAFTNPGTAAGTIRCFVTYRVHTLL
ncbi:MAG: hypothetical protein JSS91_00795 [Bacteroidetes bacterium]|nr:hypothetical protein [Bacteroidota bacterium]